MDEGVFFKSVFFWLGYGAKTSHRGVKVRQPGWMTRNVFDHGELDDSINTQSAQF
jgi:hypothetical protein